MASDRDGTCLSRSAVATPELLYSRYVALQQETKH
jgi:hypothetical protein